MNVTAEQTTDIELITRVRARYASDMKELYSLNFREVCFLSESLGPFSLLLLFPIAILMRASGEVMVSRRPLRIAAAYSLFGYQEFGTYAQPMGLGVKFYTGFTDGTALVTSNFESQDMTTERLLKIGRPQPLPWAWVFHQKQIEELRSRKHELQTRLTFYDYDVISQLEINSRPSDEKMA
jgi:hypothetical protein